MALVLVTCIINMNPNILSFADSYLMNQSLRSVWPLAGSALSFWVMQSQQHQSPRSQGRELHDGKKAVVVHRAKVTA